MYTERFTFLCSKEERLLINQLAELLHRSQGDTMRYLIRKFCQDLGLREDNYPNLHYQQIANPENLGGETGSAASDMSSMLEDTQ